MHRSVLEAEHAQLVKPIIPVEAALEAVGLSTWSTHPPPSTDMGLSLNEGLALRESLSHLGTHPNTSPFQIQNGIPCNGVLYDSNFLSTPSLEVREALMGFKVGETDIPGLPTSQRVQLLGQSKDLDSISWAIATIRAHIPTLDPTS